MATTLTLISADATLRARLVPLINRAPQFHCVGAYASAADLLSRFRSAPADLLLFDLDWRRPQWLEDLSRLRALGEGLALVVLVPEENPELLTLALARGACGYLLREQSAAQWWPALEDIQRGLTPLSGAMARQLILCLQRQTSPWQHMAHLSLREKEILEFLAHGYPYKQIASHLAISINTVRTYVRRLYAKLEVPCRAHAILKCQPLAFSSSLSAHRAPPSAPATPIA